MRTVAVVFLALTLAWLSQACSVAADGVHSLGDALSSRCGWIDDGHPPLPKPWAKAYADDGCGFLPLDVDPCDETPSRTAVNDGRPMMGWHHITSDCADYRIEWAR